MPHYKVLERTATHTIIEYPSGTRVRISNNQLGVLNYDILL